MVRTGNRARQLWITKISSQEKGGREIPCNSGAGPGVRTDAGRGTNPAGGALRSRRARIPQSRTGADGDRTRRGVPPPPRVGKGPSSEEAHGSPISEEAHGSPMGEGQVSEDPHASSPPRSRSGCASASDRVAGPLFPPVAERGKQRFAFSGLPCTVGDWEEPRSLTVPTASAGAYGRKDRTDSGCRGGRMTTSAAPIARDDAHRTATT